MMSSAAAAGNPWANPYLIQSATIVDKIREAEGIDTYRLRFVDEQARRSFRFAAGQFNMVYLFGVGEVAISIVSDPDEPEPGALCSSFELFVLQSRRKPQYPIGHITLLVTEQKGAEAENQFAKGNLVRQENAGMSPMGSVPGGRQPQEIAGVMREQGAALAGCKGEVEFVRRSQMSSFSGREALDAMLAEYRGQCDRHGFIEVESHRADLVWTPGSSSSCSAISRSIASR